MAMTQRTLLLIGLFLVALIAAVMSHRANHEDLVLRYRWNHLSTPQVHETERMPASHLDRG